jgi:hypothetical protein
MLGSSVFSVISITIPGDLESAICRYVIGAAEEALYEN